MRKYINILLLLAVAALSMTSCQEELTKDNALTDNRYVYFAPSNPTDKTESAVVATSADGTTISTDGQVSFKILRTGKDFSKSLDVDIQVSVTYASTTQFHNAGDDASSTVTFDNESAVTIPAGSTMGTITMNIKDDILSSGNKNVSIKITGVSDGSYTIGFPTKGQENITQNFAVTDDDCPIDLTLFEGEYVVNDIAPSGSTNDGLSIKAGDGGGGAIYSGTVTFTKDPSDPAGITGILSESPGGNTFGGTGPYKIKFNTCSGTISFSGIPISGDASFWIYPASSNPTSYKADGSTFSLNGQLGTPTGPAYGLWNVTFTKVN